MFLVMPVAKKDILKYYNLDFHLSDPTVRRYDPYCWKLVQMFRFVYSIKYSVIYVFNTVICALITKLP